MEFCLFLLFLVSIVFAEGKVPIYKFDCLVKKEILVIEKTHAIFVSFTGEEECLILKQKKMDQ